MRAQPWVLVVLLLAAGVVVGLWTAPQAREPQGDGASTGAVGPAGASRGPAPFARREPGEAVPPKPTSGCAEVLALATREPAGPLLADVSARIVRESSDCFLSLPPPWQFQLLRQSCRGGGVEAGLPIAFLSAWIRSGPGELPGSSADEVLDFLDCVAGTLTLVDIASSTEVGRFVGELVRTAPPLARLPRLVALLRTILRTHPIGDEAFWRPFWESTGRAPGGMVVRGNLALAAADVDPARCVAFVESVFSWSDDAPATTAATIGVYLRDGPASAELESKFVSADADGIRLVALSSLSARRLWPSAALPVLADPKSFEALSRSLQPGADEGPVHLHLRAETLRREWELGGPDVASAALYSTIAGGVREEHPEVARLRIDAALVGCVRATRGPQAAAWSAAVDRSRQALAEGLGATETPMLRRLVQWIVTDLGSDAEWGDAKELLRTALRGRLEDLTPELRDALR